MQDTSARLSLPFIQPAQAQKHVTHNQSIAQLDVLVQTVVQAFDIQTPPGNLIEGQSWALGNAPVGAWTGYPHHIATVQGGSWHFQVLQTGWHAVSGDDHTLRIWTGSQWVFPDTGPLTRLPGLGIGTVYNETQPLAVSGQSTLLTHTGSGGHQLVVNKSTATDTASLLFQTNWSGRAEMGTTGSDGFEIKVSDDGNTWRTGLRVTPATGAVSMPRGAQINEQISGTAVQTGPVDISAGRLMPVGAFGLGNTQDAPNIPDLDATDTPTGFYRYTNTTPNAASRPSGTGASGIITVTRLNQDEPTQQLTDISTGTIWTRRVVGNTWQDWSQLWASHNTTVDANGFVKAASPIIRLYADKIIEPVEPVAARFTRVGPGDYLLSDVPPLANKGWQIEVPQDHNGNRLVFINADYSFEQRSLAVHTYSVIWDAQTGRWAGGTPIDIPDERWVDLRFSRK